MTVEIKCCLFGADIQAEAVNLKNRIERELGVRVRLRPWRPGLIQDSPPWRTALLEERDRRSPNAAEIIRLIGEKRVRETDGTDFPQLQHSPTAATRPDSLVTLPAAAS